jgi:hypothetical protein
MRKEFSAEEKAAYFKGLRDRWKAAKKVAEEDGNEFRAIIENHGLNVSITGFIFCAQQMAALGLEGVPYLDCKTYQGWRENGFNVKKGEKSRITGLTWIRADGKEESELEEDEDKRGHVFPKSYHLFHRSQVVEAEK